MPEILVEEYNDGYEFNMMTWVRHGKVHVISIADREKTFVAKGEIPISTRNVYPSRLLSKVEKPATELLQAYADRTGQKDGALSMQFFWKPGEGIQVCEIAARFFGYEHELTDMVYGFNMEELLLASLYDPDKLKKCWQNTMFINHSAVELSFIFREGFLPSKISLRQSGWERKNRWKSPGSFIRKERRSLSMVLIRIWHYIM